MHEDDYLQVFFLLCLESPLTGAAILFWGEYKGKGKRRRMRYTLTKRTHVLHTIRYVSASSP